MTNTVDLLAISIQNLRCISEALNVTLKPLTLIVGANSSGKSTFLRTLPLLRQSVETVTRGPLLWFGRLVDFGDFENAVHEGEQNGEIRFGFEVRFPGMTNDSEYSTPYDGPLFYDTTVVKVRLCVASDLGSTFTRRIELDFRDRSIQLQADPDLIVKSIQLDGREVDTPGQSLRIIAGTTLFSTAVVEEADPANAEPQGFRSRLDRDILAYSPFMGLNARELVNHIRKIDSKPRNSDRFALHASLGLGIGSIEQVLDHLKKLARLREQSVLATVADELSWAEQLQDLILISKIPGILNQIDRFLSDIFRTLSYVGPVRATAERFYRQQDLSVDEVDPMGANLAMFLMGLDSEEREQFSSWCAQYVGIVVEPEKSGSHVSIKVSESGSGHPFNVADMGFGYSQLLPILATIWRAAIPSKKTRLPRDLMSRRLVRSQNIPLIVAIEQPELHLHPSLQGRLAKLMGAVAARSAADGSRIRLICETHSETIINEMGGLVSSGELDRNLVQILVFERDAESSKASVRVAEYDESGVLTNWPFGFFLSS